MKIKSLFALFVLLILLVVPLAYSFDEWDEGSPDDWDDGFDDWDDDWDEWDEGSPDDWDEGSPDEPDDEPDEPEDGEDDDDEDDGPGDIWPDNELHVASISGYSTLNAGETQILTVNVKDNYNNDISGAIVTLYYTNGAVYGACITVDGECSASHIMNYEGTYSVFATAFKYGYIPDADAYPVFTFDVIEDDNNDPYFTSRPLTSATRDADYRYDADAVDPDGDDIEYSLVQGPSGMEINRINGLVRWTPEANGKFDVVLRVTDEYDNYGEQSYTIVVSDEGISFNLGDLIVSKLRIVSDEYLMPGDELILTMNLENSGTYELDDIKVTASVLELSTRKSTGHFTLKKHDETSKTLFVDIPDYSEAGEYGLRVEVYNGDLKRIIYRDFFVK